MVPHVCLLKKERLDIQWSEEGLLVGYSPGVPREVCILDSKRQLQKIPLRVPGTAPNGVQFIKMLDSKLLVKMQNEADLWIFDLKNLEADPLSIQTEDQWFWSGVYMQIVCLKGKNQFCFIDIKARKILDSLPFPLSYWDLRYSKFREGKLTVVSSINGHGLTNFAINTYDFRHFVEKFSFKIKEYLPKIIKDKNFF
jgi:hypothetical protein